MQSDFSFPGNLKIASQEDIGLDINNSPIFIIVNKIPPCLWALFWPKVLIIYNPFVLNAPFPSPLKTSENRTVFWYFQRVEKGCIENKWVKIFYIIEAVIRFNYQRQLNGTMTWSKILKKVWQILTFCVKIETNSLLLTIIFQWS